MIIHAKTEVLMTKNHKNCLFQKSGDHPNFALSILNIRLMLTRISFCFLLIVTFQSIYGQSVGIGTATPNTCAILDINSTSKGLLIPRMTLAQRDAIVAPKLGLQVFVTSDSSMYLYQGTAWVKQRTGNEAWMLQGNNLYNANSGNVGIGTTNPVNKLSVNGTVNITDSLGIGTESPAGLLHIRSISSLDNDIDQQQTVMTNGSGGSSQWQSFTAGITGLLTRVDLSVSSPLGGTSSPGTIKIYAGEGVSGTLLSTTAVTYQSVYNTFQAFTLSGYINVISGNKYTVQFSAPTVNIGWVSVNLSNPYSGGIASFSDNADYCFKTYVSPFGDAIIASDGKIGIGTATPVNRLSVKGAMDITEKLGIGTTTPVNKLSVKGSVDITDKLGIGTASPSGELHIKSINNSANAIDQQQTVFTHGAGSDTSWQSFTAGITGLLTRVDLLVGSPLSGTSSPGTIKIYAGEGISGTLLSTTAITYQNVANSFQAFTLSVKVNIIAGNKYTILFTAPDVNVGWVNINNYNPYSGGVADYSNNGDYCFKTYVSPATDAIVITGGNVGIGTTTPASKLDITGQVKIADGTQGAGKVLSSNADGLASWTTLPGQIGNGSNAGNTLYWNGTAWVTNSGNIYNNGGNVGIGTTSPANKLSVSGDANITGKMGIGTATPATNLDVVSSVSTGTAGQIRLNAPNLTNGNITTITQGKSASYANQAEWTFNYESSGSLNNAHAFGFNAIAPFVFFTAGEKVGIGTNAPTAKLSVNGSANNSTGSWGVFSDARIKSIKGDFTDGLNIIKQINPVKFNYSDNAPFKAEGEQIGIIAQELEQIAPYMVSQKEYKDIKDLREVNNQAYVFLLINAVKELSEQNTQLKAELELIKNKLGMDSQASNR